MTRAMEGRNGDVWRLFCRGKTQEAIAEQFGISQQRVSQIVNAVRESIGPVERADIVKQETDLLDALRDEVLELFDAKPSPLISANGRIVTTDEGKQIEDHSGRLAALAAFDRLTARKHRLLGLDAPAKLDLSLQGEEEATRRAAADAIAKLHGGTDGE